MRPFTLTGGALIVLPTNKPRKILLNGDLGPTLGQQVALEAVDDSSWTVEAIAAGGQIMRLDRTLPGRLPPFRVTHVKQMLLKEELAMHMAILAPIAAMIAIKKNWRRIWYNFLTWTCRLPLDFSMLP